MTSQIVINTGSTANDGLGDPLRVAFTDVNKNFSNIWAAGPVGSNISIVNNSIITTNPNGNLKLSPNGVGSIVPTAPFVPDVPNVRFIGAATNRFNTVYSQYLDAQQGTFSGNLFVSGNLQVVGNIVTVDYTTLSVSNLNVTLANAATTAPAADGAGLLVAGANTYFTYGYSANTWNTNIAITAPTFIGDGANLTNVIANVNANNLLGNTLSSTVNTSNLTSFGLVTDLTATGDVSTTGNVYANIITGNTVIATYLSGDGSNISNIRGVDVVGNVSRANFATLAGNANIAALATQAINANTALFALNANLASYATVATSAQTANRAAYATQADNANAAVVAGMAYSLAGNANISIFGTITANYFVGDGSQLSNVNAGSQLITDNAIVNLDTVGDLNFSYANGNMLGTVGFQATRDLYLLSDAGNVIINPNSANILPTWTFSSDAGLYGTGNLSTTGNVFATTVSVIGNVNSGSIYVDGNAVITGNVLVLGNLTYSNITNITTDNLVLGLGNNQTGSYVDGGGIVVGNTNEASFRYDFNGNTWASNIGISAAGDVIGNNIQTAGNILAGNILTDGYYYANGVPIAVDFTQFDSNIIPSANVTYSLGNSTNQWKDLWVSNATIYLNSIPLSVDANSTLQFNGNSVVVAGPNVINTGNLETTGDIIGGNLSITTGGVLTFANGSTQDSAYANANVEAYLPSSNTIISINSNIANINLEIANLATTSSLSNTNSNVANLTVTVNNNSNAIANLQGLTYGNSNVAVYLSSGTVSTDIDTTANVNANSLSSSSLNANGILFAGPTGVLSTDSSLYFLDNGGGEMTLFADYLSGAIFTNDVYGNSANITLSAQFGNSVVIDTTGGISAEGNIAGNYIIGNGSQLTGLPASYSNANVASYLTVLTSNVSTTGNVDATSFNGDGANLFNVNAVQVVNGTSNVTVPTTNGNIIATVNGVYQWTFNNAGNIITPAGGTIGDTYGGNAGTSLQAAPFGYAGVNSSNQQQYVEVDDVNVFITTGYGTGNAKTWQFNQDGSVSAPGVISAVGNIYGNYFIGNGSQLTNLPSGTIISNGTSNVTIPTADANVAINVNEATYTFSDTAIFTLPNGLTIGTSTGDANINTTNSLAIGGNSGVTISTLNDTYQWIFDNTGNLNLPASSNIVGVTANNTGHINWVGNSSGDGYGYTTMNLVPDNTVNDSYLILDPTAPNHIHIRAGGTQDNSGSQLYLGGENSYFKVDAGLNPNVYVTANTQVWTYGTDGILTLPGEGVLQSISDSVTLRSLNTTTGNANSVYLGSSGGIGFNDQEIGGNWLEIFRTGTEPEIRVPVGRGNLNIQTASGNTPYNWVLDDTGNLSTPGSIILPSNSVLTGSGASPAPSINGFDSINAITFSASGNVTGGNIIASYFYGDGSNITGIAANTGNVTFSNVSIIGTGNLQLQPDSANTSAYLDVYLTTGPDIHIAGNTENVIIGRDTGANVTVGINGNVYIQADTGTAKTWNFGADGNITTPQGGLIGPAGVKGDGTMLSGGNGNLVSLTSFYSSGMLSSCYTANPDGNLTITSYGDGTGTNGQWLFNTAGNLVLPAQNVGNTTVNGTPGESQLFRGTRKIVNGVYSGTTNPFSVVLDVGGNATPAYTASNPFVQSVKITFAVQSSGSAYSWEQFDVVAVPSQDTPGTVNFTVSNRVKSTVSVTDTIVTATINGSNLLEISLNLDVAQTNGGWSSFDATEFGLMVD